MNIVIVEDEHKFALDLQRALREWSIENNNSINNITHYFSGEELIRAYKAGVTFEIAFLDIKLDGINGIEVARQLRASGYDGAIIFTSNHKEYEFVQQGYNVGALNYYAKPVTPENIVSCMSILQEGLFHEYYYKGKRISVPYKEILFFESTRNYVNIASVREETNVPHYKCSMAELVAQVPSSFVQISRSYVVNIAHIFKIEGRTLFVKLNGKIKELPISKANLKNVISAMRILK